MHRAGRLLAIILFMLLGAARGASAADWPQFMHDAARTGDADDEVLKLPLGLLAQVRLEDAVTTSPAVVGGKVYVVDQMGTAYCIDPRAGRVLWKKNPDGEKAMGANTSSPCVAGGRVCYGTTAGSFHILDARDGKVVKTIPLGWPVIASPVYANDSIYVQTLGGVVHCLDLDGKERWRWDHYKRYKKPLPGDKQVKGFPHSFARPHYSEGELCVVGRRVVVCCGWDLYCLEHGDEAPKLLWCHRALLGPNKGLPLSVSASGGYAYVAAPGVDCAGSLVAVALKDGRFHAMGTKDEWKSKDVLTGQFAVYGTPAVRGSTVYFGRSVRGFAAYQFLGTGKGWRTKWLSWHWTRPRGWTASIASPALSRDHAVFATVTGELIVVAQDSRGSDLSRFKPAPFRFKTPHGKMIASSPAISGGRVYFGCDDGYLYVLGPGGGLKPRKEVLNLHEPRSRVTPATGRKYAWPYPAADPANTGAVEDPGLRPPFRLRWAARTFGVFGPPTTTDLNNVFFSSMDCTVGAMEQATGRIRWRRRLTTGYSPAPVGGGAAVVHEGRLYLVSARNKRIYPTRGTLCCLDARTGRTLWEHPVGYLGFWARWGPVCAGKLVVMATFQGKGNDLVVQALDAENGTEVWKRKLADAKVERGSPRYGVGGCLLDGTLFYTTALKGKKGITVALNPESGEVIWKSTTHYGESGHVSGKDGRLYMGGGYSRRMPVTCLSARDGSLIWKGPMVALRRAAAIGKDCLILRYYGGTGVVLSLKDGKYVTRGGRRLHVGGPAHACAPVRIALPDISLGITAGGLRVHDLSSGRLLWTSRAFAPRTCAGPSISNGRIFVTPQSAYGTLYCFEPVGSGGRRD